MSDETLAQPPRSGRRNQPFPWGAVAISLAVVLATSIAAGSWKDVRKRPEKNNIRITGSARKRIVSDLIQWSAVIEAKAPERTAAYLALKSGTEKAVAFLKARCINNPFA